MTNSKTTFPVIRPHDWQSPVREFDKATGRFYERDDNGQLVPVQNIVAAQAQQAQADQKGKTR